MRGRPKLEDSRTNQYRIRLNDEENYKLNYASQATGKAKSEIFRLALIDYYNKVLLNEKDYMYGGNWDIDGINLNRVVCCPYCNNKIRINIEDCCSTSSTERQMGTETLYEFEFDEECPYCDHGFLISGYISEYPVGALNFEEIKAEKYEQED